MCAKREEEEEVVKEEEEEEEGTGHQHLNNIQRFQQDQQLNLEELQQQQQSMGINDYSYSNTTSWLMFPSSSSSEISPIMHHQQQPSSWSSLPQVLHQNSNYNPLFQYPTRDHDPFLFPPPPPTPLSCYGGGLFNRRSAGQGGGLQFAYGGTTSSSSDHDHLLQGHVGFGLQTHEIIMGKMTAQEMMDAKALAASKSHSEAERRRRERINNHLAKLRSLLPSTTKTDKASLLAEVIQHVKELKRQTSVIAEQCLVPTEIDELSVEKVQNAYSDHEHKDGGGKLVIRASICCDDRSDLLPDLIKTLKALKLRTLKAEITTLGGRVKNVLFITAEEDDDDDDINNNNDNQQQQTLNNIISTIQEALKQVMEKSIDGDHNTSSINGCSVVKRQRTNIIYP